MRNTKNRNITEDKLKIGIFGGAFNPVHNGHLHLIDELSRMPMYPDMKPVDKILIIPTANPPHRTTEGFASEKDRINMLNLALDNPKAEVSDIEFTLTGKNYTYNTIRALRNLYPYDEFYLFMGSDQLLMFKEWYKYKRILKLVQVVGFSRSREDNGAVRQFLLENEKLGIWAVIASPYEASSTDIRNRIKNGESIEGLVPDSVREYITEKRLYSE